MTDKKTKEAKPKEKLEDVIKQRDEYLDGWQRAKAEFLNYKKEEAAKIQDIFKYANEELIDQLIPVIDNFQRAEAHLTQEQKENETIKGVMYIKNQLAKALLENGLEQIEVLGKQFDPNTSEAIEEVEDSKEESGTVIEEVVSGYQLNGKLIRAAQVKVAK
jgi:molecular chaperone GrpE